MGLYTYKLEDINKGKLALVGGKVASLAELSGLAGILVPNGFCISTAAFRKIVHDTPNFQELMDELSEVTSSNRDHIKRLSKELRRVIEDTDIPVQIQQEVIAHLQHIGLNEAYAIRSSATAEDLPSASFAGQHDTFLNIIGEESILQHISRCWSSLFTERAITYRLQQGFDHRKVLLSVFVQKMIFPEVAGVMFTASPVTGNRKILSVDASFGLGESLVSGVVNADNYHVREGKIVEKKICGKHTAMYASADGGLKKEMISPGLQERPTLTDEQVLQLERIGRKIEDYFGFPQDIEWCCKDNDFYIVQSRPITTLFPVPEVHDSKNHVYLSVGHQQMMTDAMKPLGLTMWRSVGAGAPMYPAGGRLFVDVTAMLSTSSGRRMLLLNMAQFDPLIKDALLTIIDRDFIKLLPDENHSPKGLGGNALHSIPNTTVRDPAIVSDLIERSRESLELLKDEIQTKSGSDLFDFIVKDIAQLRRMIADPKNMELIMMPMHAASWINEKMNEWLGEKNVADVLSQSVSNNITSEMGLQLLDVADVIRTYPRVVAFLEQAKSEDFLEELRDVEGGTDSVNAIQVFLNKYGMRCAGEIDITRPRWVEKPTTIIPVLLNHVRKATAGESRRRFEQGLRAAHEKERDLLSRLRQLPDGEQKAVQVKEKIDIMRNFSGYREYPKYSIVNRLFLYKQALRKEALRLVKEGVIKEEDEINYLTFEELGEVVKTNKLDYRIILQRKEDHTFHEQLTPPRVITSEGEIITGQYNREHLPSDAIVGLAVSAGVIEGRARIILNMEDAILEEDDILITAFTDPSWTPLFLIVSGLITEVGGLMTHGAVIAREYGLPAIVGVEHATKIFKDGQRIRLNGTEGYVEILDDSTN